MKKLYILLLILPLLLGSCKKEEVSPITITTANEAARDALYGLMNDWYLWYKEMPPVLNTKDYKDPYELLEAVRYKPVDRWSFVIDYNEYIARFEQGTFVGHGISIGMDDSKKVRIAKIFNKSNLYSKGVRRGWILKKLNGSDLAQVIISGNSTLYSQLWGASQAGVTNTFIFQTPLGKDSTIISAKSTLDMNTVMLKDTLRLKSGITGHLVFDQFIEPSSAELKTAFAYFKEQNVTDLILDMRYNGGGLELILQELASYIAGNSYTGQPIIKLLCNDKHTTENRNVNFLTTLSPLNLKKLVVITTRGTASASEEVINGLKPMLTVTTIGDTTEGKPTGMSLYTDKNKKFVFAPVTFEAVNSNDAGGFYDGIPPAKFVPDDISRDFNDRNELCLKEAIHFLETGTLTAKSAYLKQKVRIITEEPEWTRNLLILNK